MAPKKSHLFYMAFGTHNGCFSVGLEVKKSNSRELTVELPGKKLDNIL